eukprot:13920546-Alexandrium_andersonii.AAC.1
MRRAPARAEPPRGAEAPRFLSPPKVFGYPPAGRFAPSGAVFALSGPWSSCCGLYAATLALRGLCCSPVLASRLVRGFAVVLRWQLQRCSTGQRGCSDRRRLSGQPFGGGFVCRAVAC